MTAGGDDGEECYIRAGGRIDVGNGRGVELRDELWKRLKARGRRWR